MDDHPVQSHCCYPPHVQQGMRDFTTMTFAEQKCDYFIVLDFEAQCEKDKQLQPQEVIEFPALLVNAKTIEITDVFHQYVMPTVHTQITPFCTELTGITQDMVEGQPDLREVLSMFNDWLFKHGLLRGSEEITPPSFTFVTCGNWDLMFCISKLRASLTRQPLSL